MSSPRTHDPVISSRRGFTPAVSARREEITARRTCPDLSERCGFGRSPRVVHSEQPRCAEEARYLAPHAVGVGVVRSPQLRVPAVRVNGDEDVGQDLVVLPEATAWGRLPPSEEASLEQIGVDLAMHEVDREAREHTPALCRTSEDHASFWRAGRVAGAARHERARGMERASRAVPAWPARAAGGGALISYRRIRRQARPDRAHSMLTAELTAPNPATGI